MKLLSFIQNGQTHTGVLTDRGVVDLTALGFPDNMNDIITGGETMIKRIANDAADRSLPVLDMASLEYANITSPQKIICVGLNYKKHAEETGGTAPEHIVLFSKFNDALAAAGKNVTLPGWQRCYDYEAELVIIIGKPAWNVTQESAPSHVFGYACGNDLSARDSQFLSSQWLAGKSFPDFAPAGPMIVTADSFNPDDVNGIYCDVNGIRVQSGDTSDMIFSCAEIVSTASRFFKLNAGDLIFTGTPPGVILGKDKDKRVWLKPGDVVQVTIDGIGTLTTPLA
ncbi:MAG: fumarylacetoacetate hydrolase family protein [Clostridiales bacterium]|nr:fumarylacetoacetate hydrolase family protein [Clostridiales bacterium]